METEFQFVSCPERECNGVAAMPITGRIERGMLVRCQACGCRFNPDDVPAHLVDAMAAEIFTRNLVAKEESNGMGANRGDTNAVESQRHRRLDGSARHVYRMDRRRRGSDQAPV